MPLRISAPRGFTDSFVAQSSCLGKSAKDPVTFKTLEPLGCDSLWQKDTKKAVLDYTAGLRAYTFGRLQPDFPEVWRV